MIDGIKGVSAQERNSGLEYQSHRQVSPNIKRGEQQPEVAVKAAVDTREGGAGKRAGRRDEEERAVNQAIEILKDTALAFDRKLDFVVHEETNRMMVRVIDSESGEIIREIPPEQLLNIVAKMHELLGLLFDKKA